MTQNTHQKSKNADRPAQAVKELAQQAGAYSNNFTEKAQAGAEAAGEAFQQNYSAAAKGALEFNTRWMEMVGANTSASLELATRLIGVKSPSEFFELTTAHSRRQFEAFGRQAQELASLAQKVTADAMKPLQTGVNTAFDKAV